MATNLAASGRDTRERHPMEPVTKQSFNWQNLADKDDYQMWRTEKLRAAEILSKRPPVTVSDLANPSESERREIAERCESANFAVYASDDSMQDPEAASAALRRFADAFGLHVAERHRSAGGSGVVALHVTDQGGKRGYIPYSSRGMNWHTDGYYNAPEDRISAFVLHCVRPAATGGENRLFDPELFYIRLRDENPDALRALMHPQAMTIPENREPDGSLRPASVGPVFYPDPGTGRLQMRYTARTRSIAWRDDPATTEAEALLRSLLQRDDPLMLQMRLDAGQGILNNNVLHDRTPFQTDAQDETAKAARGRLVLRVRFHNRVTMET